MNVLVINLDRDPDRWNRISQSLSDMSGFDVARISGIYGPDLPSAAILALTGNETSLKHRGTLGTFLSHVKAWEAVVKCDQPLTVVLEDDAILLGLQRLEELVVPQDADVVFINDRMSLGSRFAPPIGLVEFRPITESLKVLNKSAIAGVGGDGYVLTKNGAAKLLNSVQKDLFFGHVDWRLLRYSLSPSDLKGEFEGTRVSTIVLNHHNRLLPPAWNVLKAYCLSTPLVAFATGGKSTREAANSSDSSL